jgi:hypothetical protein
MGAQVVREVTVAQARALLAEGRRAPGRADTWLLPSRGVTVVVKPSGLEGYVRLVIVKGCAC